MCIQYNTINKLHTIVYDKCYIMHNRQYMDYNAYYEKQRKIYILCIRMQCKSLIEKIQWIEYSVRNNMHYYK